MDVEPSALNVLHAGRWPRPSSCQMSCCKRRCSSPGRHRPKLTFKARKARDARRTLSYAAAAAG
ncbi:MAG: hypothetical protein MZV70_07380 [Desulfobacterales bacterium]|nr:hypothetical protein [Desulfobacterales bacterium]